MYGCISVIILYIFAPCIDAFAYSKSYMLQMKATIIKEFKLLVRDPGGLFLLLLMPAILIIVMALVQDAPFKDFQDVKFEVVVVNNDKGSAGEQIKNALIQSAHFNVHAQYQNQTLNDSALVALIHKGVFQIGVIIPANTTKVLVQASNDVTRQFNPMSANADPLSVDTSVYVQLVYDPMVKPNLKNTLNVMLQQVILQTKMDILMNRIAKANSVEGDISLASFQALGIKERLSHGSLVTTATNSVQHNVPAWAIFGIFMIVVPISSSLIKEREDGSALRIKLIPNAFKAVLIGKICFYVMVCLFQFLCMMLVGLWIMPLLDLPSLHMGEHWYLLLPIVISIAFVAVSYGFLVGNLFNTNNQAMSFGAISVVLLSAIGGIWVPLEILPPAMKQLAMLSPMHWSLNGVNTIMIRNGGLTDTMLPLVVLIGLGILFTLIATFTKQKVGSM